MAITTATWLAVGWFVLQVAAVTVVGYGVGVAINAIVGVDSPEPGEINFGSGGSPTYDSFGPRSTTISNKLPVPVILGRMKVNGNMVYQTDPGEEVKQIIVLCQGPVNSISDIRINDRPYAEFPGVTITAYTGTTSQTKDSRVATLDGIDLRSYAYLAITLTASDELSGSANISCVVEGELVETYDSGTGLWSGATFSENPSALIRHVLKNSRWGVGKSDSEVDDDTFGSAYDYFAEPVDNGDSGTEARFRLNYIMDNQLPAIDHLDAMLSICRSSFVFEGKKIRLHYNKAEPVVFRFGDGSSLDTDNYDNMADNSFKWELGSIDDIPNKLIVHYIDPNQDYNEVTTVRENRIDQDERGKVITKDISLLGIQYQSQAIREAKYIEGSLIHNAVRASWAGFLDSRQIRLGQVVSVTSKVAVYQNKEFRITNIQIFDGGQRQFTGIEYNPGLYDDRLGSVLVTKQQPSGPNIFAQLSDVTNLILSEFGYQQGSSGGIGDGKHVANIDASWTAITGDQKRRLRYYLIEYSDDDGVTYKSAGYAGRGDTTYRIPDLRVGITYIVRVKTISEEAVASNGATSNLTLNGKDDPPSDVTQFIVNQNRDRILFAWTEITDVDKWGYEVRWGTSWSSGIKVSTVRGSNYITTDFRTGVGQSYWIKALDNSGNYSSNALEATITIDNIPFRNIIQEYSEQTAWAGTKEAIIVSGDNLELYYDDYTKAIIHFDGADAATAYTAETGQTVTFVGTAQLDTAQKKFGASSLLLDGNSDYVTLPDSDDWNFGTGDFTIDCWVRFNDNTGVQVICGQYIDATNWIRLLKHTAHTLLFTIAIAGVEYTVNSSEFVTQNNTWYHIAVVRSGSTCKIYGNGTDITISDTIQGNTIPDLASVLQIGHLQEGATHYYVNGWIDELRISKGIARWTENFTVPTIEYPKELTGKYKTPTRDLGYVATFKIGVDSIVSAISSDRFDSDAAAKWNDSPTRRFTGEELPGASSFKVETSEDNVVWATGDYQAGDYKCRYFAIEMTLTRESVGISLACSQMNYYADLPDVNDRGSDSVVSAATGDSVVFDKTYHQEPNVHIEITSGDGIYFKFTAKDTTGFTVMLYDATGTAKTGDYDWSSDGI